MPNIPGLDDIRDEIVRRHELIAWPKVFPWWPHPAHVNILFYADGGIRYDGGSFHGLKQVLATLLANHYPWVRFDIVTANRSNDPTADHANVDLAQALALDNFDELWIYSINSTPRLTQNELAAAQAFMDSHQGGVLITGDHANLGMAFGNLPRAGKMRDLPAPPDVAPVWNTTLRSGANAAYEFDDQSDPTPQPLTLRKILGGMGLAGPTPGTLQPARPHRYLPRPSA